MTPFDVLEALSTSNIAFSIGSVREGSIMFSAAVPGERWEIEVFEDGKVELERFRSNGEITDETASLKDLIASYAD